MRVKYLGKTYIIGWRYTKRKPYTVKVDGVQKKVGRPASSTSCYIAVETGRTEGRSGMPELEIIHTATCRLHSGDAPCNEKARRFSLQKMMAGCIPGDSNKSFRGFVWSAYLNRAQVPRSKRAVPVDDESIHAFSIH